MRGFGLLLFDCNGVLADSETIACRVDAELFTAAGFPLRFEDIRRDFVGDSAASMCRTIEERFGRKLPEDMTQRKLAAVLEAFEHELAPSRGVVVEDSVPGVVAARAAGMRVLGFHGSGHCTPGHDEKLRAAGVNGVFGDMAELPARIESARSAKRRSIP